MTCPSVAVSQNPALMEVFPQLCKSLEELRLSSLHECNPWVTPCEQSWSSLCCEVPYSGRTAGARSNLAGAGLPLFLICRPARSVGIAALAKMKACARRPCAMGTHMDRQNTLGTPSGTQRQGEPAAPLRLVLAPTDEKPRTPLCLE